MKMPSSISKVSKFLGDLKKTVQEKLGKRKVPKVTANVADLKDVPIPSNVAMRKKDGTFHVEYEEKEHIPRGTKIKVVVALSITGFAAYIAFWAQEPTDLTSSINETGQEGMVLGERTEKQGLDPAVENDELIEISIKDFQFDPMKVEIEPGQTVVWTNMDQATHTVTADEFSSKSLESGESFTHTFTETGTFDYSCTIHPNMKGIVVVGVVDAMAEEPTEEPAEEPVEETADEPVVKEEPVEEADIAEEPEILEAEIMAEEAVEEPLPLSEEILMESHVVHELPTIPEVAILAEPGDTTESASAMDAELREAAAESLLIDLPEGLPEGAVTSAALQDAVDSQATLLTSTGPEDAVYLIPLFAILYLNRRKLARVFSK